MGAARHVLFDAFEKIVFTVDDFDPHLLASKQCSEEVEVPLLNASGGREIMRGIITDIFSVDEWTCAHVQVSEMITCEENVVFRGTVCLQCNISIKNLSREGVAEFFLKAPPFIPNPRR
jgi:hypothetical protein